MKNKDAYSNYIHYDRKSKAIDYSQTGRSLKSVNVFTDSEAQSKYKVRKISDLSWSYGEVFYDTNNQFDDIGTRFSKSISCHQQDIIYHLEKAVVVLPSGSLLDMADSEHPVLMDDTVFMSLLFFHPNFIADASTQWNWRYIPFEAEKIDEKRGSIGWCYHRFYKQYFHWFFDVLPRYWVMERSGISCDKYYMGEIHKIEYTMDSLEALSCDLSKFISIGSSVIAELNNIYVATSLLCEDRFIRPSQGNGVHYKAGWSPEYIQYINQKITVWARTRTDYSGYEYIFVDRSDASHRHLKNQEELDAVLEKYNIKKVVPSYLSFPEQVVCFNDAKLIFGIHGAGLTNIAWASRSSDVNVIEIAIKEMGDPGYRMVCSGLGISYWAIEGESCNNSTHGLAFDDLRVDISKVERLLSVILV